jgi:hypothetical protein
MNKERKKGLALASIALLFFFALWIRLSKEAQGDVTPLAAESFVMVILFVLAAKLAFQRRKTVYKWYPAGKYDRIQQT